MIHVYLNPEAQRIYDLQQRRAKATSLVIAILSTTLLILILTLLVLHVHGMATGPGFHVITREGPPNKPVTEKPVSALQPRPASAPAGVSNPAIVSFERSGLSVPVPDHVPATESIGIGTGSSEGFGSGASSFGGLRGGGAFGVGIPLQRCSKTERLSRLAETGGSEAVDDAVEETLRWLQKTQHGSGSWGQQHKAGMTGLALLAYLGHCETPLSVEFGDSCTEAIVYLLDLGVKNNGKLSENLGAKHWPYEHAIATYALAEALSFSALHGYDIPNHADITEKAGQWIIDNQHPSGGWDYSYDESSSRGGDLSITGWHLQALKACSLTGLEFRDMRNCVRKALAYTEARQDVHGGFGYTGTKPAGIEIHSLTGVGVLSFQIWDQQAHRAARKGIRYLAAHSPLDYNTTNSDLYAHYYNSQAMLRYGGPTWDDYNQSFANQLLEAQLPDGSFKRPGGAGKPMAVAASFAQDTPEGIHYRNCLCALMLEVYYRYLPGTGK